MNELLESTKAELLIKRTQAKLDKNRLNRKAHLEICEIKAKRKLKPSRTPKLTERA